MDFTRSLQRMVRRYPGGTKALAARMDMSDVTLNHKASPTYPTQFFSPEEVAQLTDETDDNDFLNTLCEHRGGAFLPTTGNHRELTDEGLAKVMREASEFVVASADARRADGPGGKEVSDNELARIEREGADAIAAIQEEMRRARASNRRTKTGHLRAA